MNIRLRRNKKKDKETKSAATTSFNPAENFSSTTYMPATAKKSIRPAMKRKFHSSKSSYEPHSRPRVAQKHHGIRSYKRRRNASSHYTYTASPFSCSLPTQRGPHSPPQSISARCKSLFARIRRRIHIWKFGVLLDIDRFRAWLSKKLDPGNMVKWLKIHILRKKPEPIRPYVPRGPPSYEAIQKQQAAMASMTSSSNGSGDEKKGRMRRLSQSTIKSLKKACSLNSERDELRAEDRRAMQRLEELWTTRDQ
jgi:hypothetical protein